MTGHVSFHAWRGAELAGGLHLGTTGDGTGLRLTTPVGTRRYVDPHTATSHGEHAWAAWLSPAVTPGHRFTSLVPSWNATTPDDSWLEVEVRVSSDGTTWTRWFTLGRWASTTTTVAPTSVAGQSCDQGEVDTDELLARDGVTWSTYQLRVVLHRGPASDAVPTVSLVGAVVAHPGEHRAGVSTLRQAQDTASPTARAGSTARDGVELAVPAYSQQLHRGTGAHGSGGESWCSPTATAMVLGYWGRTPPEAELATIARDLPDPAVEHAARGVQDLAYGAGNWSFNTAYAARHGVEAFVTRLRSLDEAELFVRADIPLVASLSFRGDELDGAGYDTSGHLLTVIGFDAAGDVVCNDPASHQRPSNDEVRVVYDRKQLETAWLDGSGGLVYVIRPPDVPLPAPAVPAEPNW